MSDPGAVERFYGRWAGLYDLLATRTPGVRMFRERAVDSMSLSPGDTAVEMGCGTGANLPYLRDEVGETGRVVGVDLTPGMLLKARRRVERAGWRNVHVARADATRPPVAEADGVLGTFVVGMFEDPEAAVRGWADVVGSDGRVVLLDAAPRGRRGVLDAAFRLFVAAGAPPTWQIRYEESPAESLGERVERARAGLAERCRITDDDRYARSFLRLTAGTVR